MSAAAVSLRLRVAALVAVAVAVVAVLCSVATYALTERSLSRELDRTLGRELTRVLQQAKDSPSGPSGSADCAWIGSPACVQVVDGSGRVVVAPRRGSTLPVTDAVRRVAASGGPSFSTRARFLGHPVLVRVVGLDRGRAVQVAVRSDGVQRTMGRLRDVLLLIAGVTILLAAALGYAVARTALAPVTRLVGLVERVTATRDAGHRIETEGRDEIARLGRSINAMLEALDAAHETQRRFVADASHELRTPLTSMRTNLDVLRRRPDLSEEEARTIVAETRDELLEMSRLLEDLIELARGDEEPAGGEDVDLEALVDEAVRASATRWSAVEIVADTEPVTIRGTRPHVARAILNLIDNAAKFSPDGGRVAVTLRPDALTVTDQGAGIPAEDLPHVTERFYRASVARGAPGSGLGLAIVAQVAEQYGMRLRLESTVGRGTTARLLLPDGRRRSPIGYTTATGR